MKTCGYAIPQEHSPKASPNASLLLSQNVNANNAFIRLLPINSNCSHALETLNLNALSLQTLKALLIFLPIRFAATKLIKACFP